jgi:hypothetical protein
MPPEMLRAHLPGFLLSAAVVAAAGGVYASVDGDRAAPRSVQLSGGSPASEVRLPAEALPRSPRHRTRARAKRRTGEHAATRGVVRWSAGGVVPGRSGSYSIRGVTYAAGGGTRPQLGSAPAKPVTLAPAPVAIPPQAAPASSAGDPGDGGEPGRVRAPEVAAQPEPTGSDEGNAVSVEDLQGEAGSDAAESGGDDPSGDDPSDDDGAAAEDGP